ncbi:uncharacterized protein LOC111789724 [Cucurbita pepo subsp. pepo]|uniref:uncharacterized protein LOC111789724 n=1 Tax=Cucurbita pepo subsp. pepo TaxID=3664 RepID=UPI000C9D3DD7|nr:uncharacterized protein LOC111789724 [Cucurbita pepo subsp. pepo]
MRIRKRQVPLPFSSLSPLPLSDPLLRRTPPVQLHLQLPSSDPPNLHPYACDSAAYHTNNALGKKDQLEQHDSRETTVFGAETSNGVLPLSSSSPQVCDGQWCERDKEFPLKKRRGSFERQSDDDQNNADDQTTTTAAAMESLPDHKKTTKNKKQPKLGLNLAGKKRSRGGALMEGSRCSRVNGRGWRCCQQTLVGYSLCEHHLGKGRLRSMNNVRSRSLSAAAAATLKNIVTVDKDEKKPPPCPPPPSPSLTLASKKRTKLGLVKARSISSLLGQPDSMAAIPPPPPPSQSTLPNDNINQ